MAPERMLFDALIPSLEEVGARFERGDYFVPEMLIAARAMQGALDILRPLLADTESAQIGTFLMGTVKGDVHDIGKNLCNIMLEGAGFNVIDLGVNVAPETFIEQIEEHKPDVVGFSAFLTTTMPMFKANINALEKAGLRDQVIVMVGGAPVTQEYADAVGADGYAADASTAVRKAKELIELRREKVPADAAYGSAVATKTVTIGSDQPFCIIGERINPTGRKAFAEELRDGDLSTVEADALAQVAAGADMLDVNAGIPLVDEAELLKADADATGAGHGRRADLHRLLGDRGARGRTVGLRGPGAGELGDRRGRAARAGAAAGRAPRRCGDRACQRRDRHPDDAPRSGCATRARSCRPPATTESRPDGRGDRPAGDARRRRHRRPSRPRWWRCG